MNEETQLLGCFMVFVGTMYSQAGDAIGKALDAKSNAVIAEHNAQEEVTLAAVRSLVGAHEKKLTLVEDMKMIFSAQSELLGMLAAAKSMELQYVLRAEIVKKLDYLALKEDQLKSSQQAMLVSAVSATVEKTFLSDEKLKDAALNEALAVIADPNKKSSDLVGDLFSSQFKSFADTISKKTGQEQVLTPEALEAANAEVLALRKRSGNDDTDMSKFNQKLVL